MQDIGMEYDEGKTLELCKTVKEIALSNCETEDQKTAVKDMTVGKLEDMGVLCRKGKVLAPTHAFSLLTDNKSRFAKIQCATFKGNVRDEFIDRKEFGGPIYELPIKSIRELVANAVIHRSYLAESKIQVSVFDDRLEVVSPGMLYGGMNFEAMKSGRSKCRNQAIADIFQYMHIVDAWGTGIPRLITACKQYGLQEPTFEEFGDGIKVTVYRTQADKQIGKRTNEQTNKRTDEQTNNKMSDHKEKILEYLGSVEDASSSDIAKVLGLSQSRIRLILSEMDEEVESIGATNKRRYRKK